MNYPYVAYYFFEETRYEMCLHAIRLCDENGSRNISKRKLSVMLKLVTTNRLKKEIWMNFGALFLLISDLKGG
jgi:hypothetical protein